MEKKVLKDSGSAIFVLGTIIAQTLLHFTAQTGEIMFSMMHPQFKRQENKQVPQAVKTKINPLSP